MNIPAHKTGRTPNQGSYLSRVVERVAARDERALAELYDRTCSSVHGLAIRVLGDAAKAEEVTQDVYQLAWERAASFDPRRGTAWSWLLTMARNRAIDRVRSTAGREAREAPAEEAIAVMDPNPDPESVADLEDRRARVRRALQTLTPEQREPIELAFFEGLSHGAIARRLHEPLGTVKTRIRSGIRRLARFLLPEEGLS